MAKRHRRVIGQLDETSADNTGGRDKSRVLGGGRMDGQKQRSIYLYPWESRQPWESWLSLHRKSVTCYS